VTERIGVFEQLSSSSALGQPEIFGIIRRHGGTGSILVAVIVTIVTIPTIFIILADNSGKNLDFAIENHDETFTTSGFLDAWMTGTIAPLIELTTESVGLMFELFELARSQEAVAARSVDMGDRRIDDRRLGGTANLGEIRQ
jgi:hypothetical protein